MRTVLATRYVLPLREGGSLPAIVEGDDLGMYVVKFRGAGQGALALTAEIAAGEIGRALGLNVPEIVLVDVDPALGRNDPDAEIRHLLKASVGLNAGLDYLPGSTDFNPMAVDSVAEKLASMAVWFDAFVLNVDRTPRNPNLLLWHRELRFIDHGAAMYVHHNWDTMTEKARSPFPQSSEHILLPWATAIPEASAKAHRLLTAETLQRIVALVPDVFLTTPGIDLSPPERRDAYVRFFMERLQCSTIFEEEAIRARERKL